MARVDDAGTVVMGLLAHDLRNPLTAVQLNAQLIERAAAAAGRDKERHWAALIVGAARRMDGLIRQLAETERLRQGQVELTRQAVMWDQMWREVLARSSAELDTRRVRLTLPPEPVVVLADRERLDRAIHGILCLAMQQSDGVIAIEVATRDHEVRSVLHAPRAAVAAAAVCPGDGQSPAATARVALYFARTLFECHGGSLRAGDDDSQTVDFELILPTDPATSART